MKIINFMLTLALIDCYTYTPPYVLMYLRTYLGTSSSRIYEYLSFIATNQ